MQTTSKPKTWTREKMLALPEWPAQRDTAKRRLKYLNLPNFNPYDPTIQNGFATITVEGVEYRANGNTRSLCDQKGDLKLPAEVHGDAYRCASFDDGQVVYNGIDNVSTSKGAMDRLTSALKANTMGVRSKLFAAGRGTTGIAISWNALHGTSPSNHAPWDTEGMVLEFKPEIMILDKLMNEHKIAAGDPVITCPAIQTAILLSLYRARYFGGKNSVNEVKGWWTDFIIARGNVPRDSDLGSNSPVIKLWNVVKNDLNESKKQRSRVTWYMIAEKALHLFEERGRTEIERVVVSKESKLLRTFCTRLKSKDEAGWQDVGSGKSSRASHKNSATVQPSAE